MAEITQAEQIRLGDFKEQFASTKKNIDSANDELENILVKRDLAASAFSLDKEQKNAEIAKLNEEKQSLLEFISSETKRVNELAEKHEEYVKETEKDFARKEMDIFAKHEEADMAIESSVNQVNVYEEKIKEAKEESEKIESVLIDTQELVKKSQSQLSQLDSDIKEGSKKLEQIKKDIESSLQLGQKELLRLATELDKAKMDVAKEIDKTFVPRESLAAEKEAFERYKMDVRVLYARANQMWSLMYPGKSLEGSITPQ